MRSVLPIFLAFLLAACGSSRDAAPESPRATAQAETPRSEAARPEAPRQGASQTAPAARAAYVEGTDPAAEALLAEGVAAMDEADFEAAGERFERLANNEAAPIPLRSDALRYLGRVQVALGDEEAARDTMTRLIALEPPIIELNPDTEPPPLLRTYFAARQVADGGYAVRSTRPQTLAIVNFTNSSITDHERWEPMQQGLASLMIHAMGGATDLHLVERERIRWLLEEHDLQRDPSRIDQATAVQAGRLLGAQTVVFGSFIVNGRDLIVSARLVEVETGRIVFSEQNRGRADRFDEIIEQLSLQVTRALNVELASADVETRSLDAALAYSEGLALIEQGDYAGAQGKFRQALQYDPNYGRARERVQSLAPLLAAR